MQIIKESDSFRLSLNKQKCQAPEGLFHIEMVQEQIVDGEIDTVSTYQFFLTNEEIKALSNALVE